MDEAKLYAYFDRRFEEMRQRITEDVDRRFEEMRQRITEDVTESVMARITPLFDELFRRVEALERRCDAMEEQIRHNGVLIEDLRSQVELMAENVASFDGKLDRARKELRGEIRDVRRDLEGFAAHTRKRFEDLEPRVERLEARVA